MHLDLQRMHKSVFICDLPQTVRRTFNRRMICVKVKTIPAIHLRFRKITYSNPPGGPTSCPTNGPQSELLKKNNRKCNDIWTKFGFEVGCQVVPTGVSGYEGSTNLRRKKNKTVSRCFRTCRVGAGLFFF